ncbi:MAG: hypothetical protein UT34_C0001G0370 [candidate division WS6 bacterium GW2011_GWF2_39_15]|uniref:Pyrimidine nucleoside phosphorylase C-terminal domain-containing protein n=1 Tax=candidate division WS6 bacterium GW2011_GWF2_39_15 TaxID=1619100 RepID=A0A0G0Q7C0_9BACT|nr:MAG: hypothetical protein UT34_C0001G0370 [candidate division WS6 bacterium GW2011_GWF2_39_15]
MDLDNGDELYVMIHVKDALSEGIHDGDLIEMGIGEIDLNVRVSLSETEIEEGYIGLYRDIWTVHEFVNDSYVFIQPVSPSESIEYIKKKMLGNRLTKEQLELIMKDMGSRRLGMIENAYFLSTFFNPGFDDNELLWMTEGMANSGSTLSFKEFSKNGTVIDKHSIGGIAGKGITPIIVPILASAGLVVPNASTRAITSPAGTSDILEVVMPVALSSEQIVETVRKVGACMVWGGAVDLAPADDLLIHVERVIHLESFQKLLVSIVAKKISMGLTHVLIDIPHGRGTKVQNIEDVEMIEKGFKKLFDAVGIKVAFYIRDIKNPDGPGIGPNLEMIEVLKVLGQKEGHSEYLENTAADMAGKLMELCGSAQQGEGKDKACEILKSGRALKKFWEIAFAQGATEEVSEEKIRVGEYSTQVKAEKGGIIKMWSNREIKKITKYLGTPVIKESGIYVEKLAGDRVEKGDVLFTMYSSSQSRIDHALSVVNLNTLVELS